MAQVAEFDGCPPNLRESADVLGWKPTELSARSTFRFWWALPIVLSALMHGGLMVGMAVWRLRADLREAEALIVSAPVLQPDFDSLTQVKIEPMRPELVTVNDSANRPETGGSSPPSLAAPLTVIPETNAGSGVASSSLRDIQGLFGAGSGRLIGADDAAEVDPDQGQGGAEFFGVRAPGRRFIFVVDSSQSMRGRKWAAACKELLASVGRLNAQQSFYVIFFDIDTHPMFDQRKPERDLLPANEKNQKKLKRWLASIKLGVETKPLHSMQLALAMKPDAIYLLSDGEFADPTRDFLLDENVVVDDEGLRLPKAPVHTIGFHSHAAGAMLAPIAHENGGEYRFVPSRKPRR